MSSGKVVPFDDIQMDLQFTPIFSLSDISHICTLPKEIPLQTPILVWATLSFAWVYTGF